MQQFIFLVQLKKKLYLVYVFIKKNTVFVFFLIQQFVSKAKGLFNPNQQKPVNSAPKQVPPKQVPPKQVPPTQDFVDLYEDSYFGQAHDVDRDVDLYEDVEPTQPQILPSFNLVLNKFFYSFIDLNESERTNLSVQYLIKKEFQCFDLDVPSRFFIQCAFSQFLQKILPMIAKTTMIAKSATEKHNTRYINWLLKKRGINQKLFYDRMRFYPLFRRELKTYEAAFGHHTLDFYEYQRILFVLLEEFPDSGVLFVNDFQFNIQLDVFYSKEKDYKTIRYNTVIMNTHPDKVNTEKFLVLQKALLDGMFDSNVETFLFNIWIPHVPENSWLFVK